jgi:hypothetical protein
MCKGAQISSAVLLPSDWQVLPKAEEDQENKTSMESKSDVPCPLSANGHPQHRTGSTMQSAAPGIRNGRNRAFIAGIGVQT